MKFIDRDGDTWEAVSEDILRCIERVDGGPSGGELPRAECEDEYGPLRPVGDDDEEPEPASGPTLSGVMSRASVFQAAHSMVSGLAWGEEQKPSVYDVLQVAKWMAE